MPAVRRRTSLLPNVCWRIATSARASRSTGVTTPSCAAARCFRAARPTRASSRRCPARRWASRWASPAIRATGKSIPVMRPRRPCWKRCARVVAVGARPIGLTDCLNFGNPRKPEQYGDLRCRDRRLGARRARARPPFVSGNVSLYNEVGERQRDSGLADRRLRRCDRRRRRASSRRVSKQAGSALLWIGSRELADRRFGTRRTARTDSDPLPSIAYPAERVAIGIVREAIDLGVLRSCRAIGDGGVLTALARLAFDAMLAGRRVGAEIDFGNPLCEAGGFLCEVSDAIGRSTSPARLRIGADDRRLASCVVNGVAL